MWFKVDDLLAFHGKTVQAGNAAMGLWVRAGSWCGANLTDGHVPDSVVSKLGTRAQANALVTAGLWHRLPDGYLFHDWNDYQPTKADVEERRQKRAKAGRRGAQARWDGEANIVNIAERR